MTQEEYTAQMADIKKEYDKKCAELNDYFAKTNNPYKFGDILQGIGRCLKVVKMEVATPCGRPCMAYHGYLLNKKMKQCKGQSKLTVMYQTEVRGKVNN